MQNRMIDQRRDLNVNWDEPADADASVYFYPPIHESCIQAWTIPRNEQTWLGARAVREGDAIVVVVANLILLMWLCFCLWLWPKWSKWSKCLMVEAQSFSRRVNDDLAAPQRTVRLRGDGWMAGRPFVSGDLSGG